jgi:hypothetical protein
MLYTFAKIKNGDIITFPYAFDELCADNPDKIFTGNIDIMQLFLESDQPSLGYEIVKVFYPDKPRITNEQEAYRLDIPVFEDNVWVLKWVIIDLTIDQLIEKMKMFPPI